MTLMQYAYPAPRGAAPWGAPAAGPYMNFAGKSMNPWSAGPVGPRSAGPVGPWSAGPVGPWSTLSAGGYAAPAPWMAGAAAPADRTAPWQAAPAPWATAPAGKAAPAPWATAPAGKASPAPWATAPFGRVTPDPWATAPAGKAAPIGLTPYGSQLPGVAGDLDPSEFMADLPTIVNSALQAVIPAIYGLLQIPSMIGGYQVETEETEQWEDIAVNLMPGAEEPGEPPAASVAGEEPPAQA